MHASFKLAASLVLAAFTTAAPAAEPVTARQIVDRIQRETKLSWDKPTLDTFKAGDPDAPVQGIAVAMMPTLEVLKRASAAGANFIITHEPTFYDHHDSVAALEKENDAVLAAKQAFIREHGLVIWRFHDHPHEMQPDMIDVGVIRALDWERYQKNPDIPKFVFPETTLAEFAARIKTQLGIRTLRVVGDPQLKITTAGLSPGFGGFTANRRLLQADDVDVLVFGEAHEWETIAYGVDAIATGRHKALIVLGHIPSEEAGMMECARWLKTFVTEVPVTFIRTPEPFWSPAEK